MAGEVTEVTGEVNRGVGVGDAGHAPPMSREQLRGCLKMLAREREDEAPLAQHQRGAPSGNSLTITRAASKGERATSRTGSSATSSATSTSFNVLFRNPDEEVIAGKVTTTLDKID